MKNEEKYVTYEQMKKKELIEFIVSIRPKADVYDRICQDLHLPNYNLWSYIEKKNKEIKRLKNKIKTIKNEKNI